MKTKHLFLNIARDFLATAWFTSLLVLSLAVACAAFLFPLYVVCEFGFAWGILSAVATCLIADFVVYRLTR